MAIGLPAKYQIVVKSDLSREQFNETSINVMKKIGWKVRVATHEYIQAKSRFNLYTFGETIEVIYKDMNHIQLVSTCNFQLFDAHKNKINLRTFWGYFSN